MKDVQILARAKNGETYTIRGRGTLQQTPREIVDRTMEQFRDFLARDGSGPTVSVEHYELVDRSDNDGPDQSPYVTFHVQSSTEEPYCRRNYGAQFESNGGARAQGPVGYSEQQERSD